MKVTHATAGLRALARSVRPVGHCLALVVALALGACGGGVDRTKAQVRLVNASDGYPALDFIVEGSLRQGGVAYGGSAGYAEVDTEDNDTTIAATGSPTALLSFTPSLARNRHYSVLAFGGTGALRQLVVEENAAEPSNNRTALRVVNAAPDAGSLDVYVTADGDALASAVPARAAAAYGELSPVIDVASGTWRVRVAAANSKTDLRLDVRDVAFGNRAAVTLVLTPSRGGALVNALLLVQEGGITRLDSTQARVRVVAGVADSGAVTATLGGTPLMSGIGSPAVGGYALVSAGTPPLAISVNGNSVGAPATVLQPGGDYTLLVFGALAAPQAAWVEDNNRLPTVAGTANIRLVNAASALPGVLSMTVDALPVAGNVAAGAASTPYVAVDATEVGAISVTAVGAATPVFSATGQRLLDAGVYSVFVVGTSGATSGILRRDR
ncbi:MAG: DUF4397 domain-containing protein [Rubrivivax sp.]|nr:DUF4397 domain-containing protein [Rubrivivax sp.]